jgi:hypothetical protein
VRWESLRERRGSPRQHIVAVTTPHLGEKTQSGIPRAVVPAIQPAPASRETVEQLDRGFTHRRGKMGCRRIDGDHCGPPSFDAKQSGPSIALEPLRAY